MGIVARSCMAVLLAFAVTPAASHHGWLWAENENFELAGIVRSAKLGNPHGLLIVEAKGGTATSGTWTVEVGQPWRNERAGLTDDMLAPGVELTARGHRSSDQSQRLMKAERIIIAGRVFDLYPERD